MGNHVLTRKKKQAVSLCRLLFQKRKYPPVKPWKSALEDQDCEIDWIKAYAGQTMEISSGDAWIITGSPQSVYDEEDWMLRLEVNIRDGA